MWSIILFLKCHAANTHVSRTAHCTQVEIFLRGRWTWNHEWTDHGTAKQGREGFFVLVHSYLLYKVFSQSPTMLIVFFHLSVQLLEALDWKFMHETDLVMVQIFTVFTVTILPCVWKGLQTFHVDLLVICKCCRKQILTRWWKMYVMVILFPKRYEWYSFM